MTYVLPEDDPLVALVICLDRDLARGGAGMISQQPNAGWDAIEPLPRRLLASTPRLAALGLVPIQGEAVHDLVRIARAFAKAVKDHRYGGPLQAGHDSPWAAQALRAVIPALLAIEASLATLDGVPAPAHGVIEAIGDEIRRVGLVYAHRERYYRVVGELARRVLSLEARLAHLSAPATSPA